LSLLVSESTLRVTRVGAFTLNEAHTLVPTRTRRTRAARRSGTRRCDIAGLDSVRSKGSQDGETHFEAACTVEGERPRGPPASLHRQLVTLPTNMGVDLIVGITGHVQDHLLTRTLIFCPLGVVFPPAMVMLMVSVSSLTDGELAKLDVGCGGR
jgi:hypothetical protein